MMIINRFAAETGLFKLFLPDFARAEAADGSPEVDQGRTHSPPELVSLKHPQSRRAAGERKCFAIALGGFDEAQRRIGGYRRVGARIVVAAGDIKIPYC